MRFEVVIVGGGIVGSACADALTRHGMQVALIERDCLGSGATAASMGHLVVLDDDAAELALSAYSCARWREESDALPAAAEYRNVGTVWVATDADEMGTAELKQSRLASAGIASDLLDARRLATVEPALSSRLAGGLRVASDAVIYPPVAAAHFARRAQARGATLVTGSSVRALGSDGVVLDDGREIRADAIVLANGCAVPDLLRCVPIRKRKGHLLITTRGAPAVAHQLVELGYGASAHGDASESVAFNVQPRPTGQLLIGSTRQFDDSSSEITPRLLKQLLDRACEFLPRLADVQALRAWTGFRPTTPDHRPLIGRWPLRDRVWLACGHEGLGVTTALGTADLIAAQIVGLPAPFDAAAFAPARYAPETHDVT